MRTSCLQKTASDVLELFYFILFSFFSLKRNKRSSSNNNSLACVPLRPLQPSYVSLSFQIAVTSCVARCHMKYIVYIGYVLYAVFLVVVLEAGCGALNTQTVFPSHGTHLVAVGRPSTPQICGGSQGCHVDRVILQIKMFKRVYGSDPSGEGRGPETIRLGTLGGSKSLIKPLLEEKRSLHQTKAQNRACSEDDPRKPKRLAVRGYTLLTTVRGCGASRRLQICLCSCPARLDPSRPSDP